MVLVTAPDAAAAAALGRALVEERLAACATVAPGITSIYRWQGEVRAEPEAQLLLKTRRGVLPALFSRAAELHPYDVPELLALPALASKAYADWVREVTSPSPDGAAS